MLVSGLSCAKGFIKFKQVVFAHTLDNQRVSNSVFKVTRIIYIVRQEAMESFASPNYLFYGKLHIDKLLYH